MIASRIFALLPLAVLAVATPTGGSTNSCNTGSASCCDSTSQASSLTQQQAGILGGLGIAVGSLTGLVGFSCSSLTVIGTSTSCSANQEPVCCTDNTFNGVVNLGCSPLNVNL
ncbi:fungal hydrophobin [Leucogyrophana mollusca]|uniref:Fungal hydrophobin n=1 Tax=Leucogyrophana mollusca TaxID=85980 RepID=A0ACB8B1U7_9AGAM|nr:fungal hydrophobin [Leucogyrophana mollusca]